jgi:ATP-dependent helicase HrpB
MESLPIDDILPQVVSHLATSGALVLKAEPGAGKTTRVPPAILDAGLASLPSGKPGQIVVLQPRRVAARAAAARMSDERGTTLGADVGYRVRHEGRSSRSTRILVCTVGVFLRRLQDDPSIEDVAVVIFDEFHERSVDSDLALALTRQVKQEIRPDLAVIVMSATMDSAPIAAYLSDCPMIECPGRTFPIAIEYLPHPANQPTDRLAADGVERMIGRTAGDLLVFLPGVAEINRTQENLEAAATRHNLSLMPLYGDMPLPAQQAVLQPCKLRKVVLATNVAETSLTIDGVTAVIDSGLARINRFDPGIGFNRLELSKISKASATQRAGRAGRTSPGSCLRLWSEREQHMLADFELPEIERLELSECVLQLMAWGERDVYAFPWFEKPPLAAIEKALILLERLGATSAGALTDLGRAMSRLPLQPRLARLLLEGARLGQPEGAALCAALLSERPPFKSTEAQTRASRQSHQAHHSHQTHQTILAHHTDSDVLEQVRALEAFADNNERHSIMGEISPGAARQILRASDQLLRLLDDCDYSRENKAQTKGQARAKNADEAVLRAIMAAFPDRICKRRQPREPRGVMVGGRGVKLAETSTVCDPQLFVAVDMIDLNKAELSVRRASAVEMGWLPASLISTSVDVAYDSSREKVVALKRTRFCDLVLDETIASLPPDIDPGAVLAEAVLANFDLATLVDEKAIDYLARLQCLRQWLPELELPDLGQDPWRSFLPAWCSGCASIAELRATPLVEAIKSSLTAEQITALERDAPEHITMRGGRRVKLQYEPGKPPVLAARIQELFGLAQTPRIARSRISVIMHVLAPNYRVQQITPDLASFWKNTYPDVKKQLKGRYPKHAWPDDPLKP